MTSPMTWSTSRGSGLNYRVEPLATGQAMASAIGR